MTRSSGRLPRWRTSSRIRGVARRTAVVRSEVAVTEAWPLAEAVTRTESRWPRSAAVARYLGLVAPGTTTPSLSHW